MALRARKPEAIVKRLKLFMFGGAGVGKTTAAIQFPKSYIIDTERGTENYDRLIKESGSVVYQTTDVHEVIAEVTSLLTEQHDYRTLVIDPISPVYQDLLDRSEQKVGTDFGRHYGEANKHMKRLVNLIMKLDMNVVMTSHAKNEYGQNLAVLGQTFDAWKRLDYMFDLVINLTKIGKGAGAKRVGNVVKTRLEQFPDGDSFEWSYAAICERYDVATLEREAETVKLATPDQVRELKDLLGVVRLPDGTTDKWLSKADVETFEDLPADVIAKCIDYVKGRLPQTAGAA